MNIELEYLKLHNLLQVRCEYMTCCSEDGDDTEVEYLSFTSCGVPSDADLDDLTELLEELQLDMHSDVLVDTNPLAYHEFCIDWKTSIYAMSMYSIIFGFKSWVWKWIIVNSKLICILQNSIWFSYINSI